MQRKVGMKRGNDRVGGVLIPLETFRLLTKSLPDTIRDSLLSHFEQNFRRRQVRIERSAWVLLLWLDRSNK